MIHRDEVRHIAQLARIEIKPSEEEQLEKELSAILEFVEKLNGVDTQKILPMSGGTSLEHILRADEPEEELQNKQIDLIQASPAYRTGWIQTKAVFD